MVKKEKELKEKLGEYFVSDEELLNEYGLDEYTVKHRAFLKIRGFLVEICNKKPVIKKNIYYDDEREAPEDTFETFKNYNLTLSSPRVLRNYEDYRGMFIYKIRKYNGNFELDVYPKLDNDYYEEYSLNKEEREHVLILLKEVEKEFIKRLERYWKQYQDKVNICGYWANR